MIETLERQREASEGASELWEHTVARMRRSLFGSHVKRWRRAELGGQGVQLAAMGEGVEGVDGGVEDTV